MSRCVLLLSLLWSLVEVSSQQTFPYVTFMGQTLANHSYVDLSLVGYYYSYDRVQCHTDLGTCCRGIHGVHRGDWYFPNGDRLQFSNGDGDIYEHRDTQRVDLCRSNSAISPVGIYRCDIPTVAIHDYDDLTVRDTVYVGLYTTLKGNKSPLEVIPSQHFVKCLSVDFSCAHTQSTPLHTEIVACEWLDT